MKKVTSCENCGSNKFELIDSQKYREIKFTINKCKGCGLFFQNPMPTRKYLKKLYEDIYNKKCNLVSAESAFEEKNIKQEQKRIKEIEKFKNGGRIIDIGASTGFFLAEIQKRKNWVPFGVEYSKKAVQKALREYGIRLLHGDIHSNRISDNFFDVVTMHSVLEHIPNISKTLKGVNRKLKKGGLFVFNVPNIWSFEYYLYKFLGKPFPGFIFEHLYYFTPKLITNILEKNEFRVVHITSRHHSTLRFPGVRPFIGLLTFFPKLFLEYTSLGGKLKFGNIMYVYAKKIN